MWGIATSGVIIANGLSGELADPFYPAVWKGGRCKEATLSDCVEKVDTCLAHPQ